ncbi:phytase [Amycolatopsis mediterranei]|uniref:phytase n=1 Tax=Amycolatopsis mediterranei TaxID=33910 RepID=UPI00343EB947
MAVAAVSLLTAVPASAAPREPAPVLQTQAFVDDPGASPANADADDPAIWVHPRDPGRSVVLGTLKEGGLAAFDLGARTLQLVPAGPGGRFNNVDVVGDLAVVSDRGRDRVRVYRIDLAGAAAGSAVLRDSRFVVYGKHVRDLRIVAGRGTDSVEHSDGSAISTASLGRRFPHGLLVVHDGERHPAAGDLPTTGFAFVRLEDVLGR